MPITDHNIAQNERNTFISSQHISKIDKYGSKYSLHKIAHVQIRDMHTSSSEGVITWSFGLELTQANGTKTYRTLYTGVRAKPHLCILEQDLATNRVAKIFWLITSYHCN